MNTEKTFDYLVIGAGSGGLLAYVGLKNLGKNVAIVSKNIGGDCTQYGCVPSKTFLHLAKEYRLTIDPVKKAKIKDESLNSIRKMVQEFTHEENKLVLGESYFDGTAEFINGKSVKVIYPDKSIAIIGFRKKCIIATGSSPTRATISGVPVEKIITNEDFFELSVLPKSITIIGGGPIGAEFATACASFGVETYMLSPDYLSREPKEISARSLQSLKKLGVQYFPLKADHLENNRLYLEDGTNIPETDYYLIAIGRKPNVQVGLEHANIKYSQKGIVVDRNLYTANKNIFAIGDCTQNPQFTHLAANQGKFVLKKILIPFAKNSERSLPRVTFTSPTIASAGQLEENNFSKKFVLDFANLDRAKTNYDKESYGEVFVDIRYGYILGASLFGDFAEDLINVFTLMIDEKIPLLKLANFMTPYPTYGNIFHSLVIEYFSFISKDWKKHPIRTIYQLWGYVRS